MITLKKSINLGSANNPLPFPTSHLLSCTLSKSIVQILEMEDVLFHLNSAVMMPEAPAGNSSTQGSNDPSLTAQQQKVSGLSALALVLKELELDIRKKIIIAGHTDTSGTPAFNFTLSELRAISILCILNGDRDRWALNSECRHQVEDYQQIMKHYAVARGWDCDPGNLDNIWGDKTSRATRQFLEQTIPAEAEALHSQIQRNNQKKWPARVWQTVFDLYSEDLAKTLNTNTVELAQFRGKLRFVDNSKPCVFCGESFPIDSSEKSNYRSQQNRRVEIYFFNDGESPEIDCPVITDRTHTPLECPLQNSIFIFREYIDPNDLFAIAYHLKFDYYDRVKQRTNPVPEGMRLRAFKSDGTEIPTRQYTFDNAYCVIVRFSSQAEANANANTVYFTCDNKDLWVFTDSSSPSSNPVIVTNVEEKEWNRLTTVQRNGKFCLSVLTPVQRVQYYDLPPSWDSRNWPCKVGANTGTFSSHMTVRTSQTTPLTFNLDIIVLLDSSGGTQLILDEDHQKTSRPLDPAKSRVKLFYFDLTTGILHLFKKNAADNSSRIPFGTNLINEDCQNVVMVFFRNGFYPVTTRRTQSETDWVIKKFIVGARAAVRNDSDSIETFEMKHVLAIQGNTGDYDLIYGHHLSVFNGHPYSFLFVYVSISFMRDSRWADGNAGHPVPAQAAVQRFIDEGVYNAMNKYNDKKYIFDEEPATADSTIILPFYFFDERETFIVDDPTRPTGIDFDKPAPKTTLMNHAAVTRARQNAYGGQSKFLAMICADDPAGSQYGPAYHHAVRDDSHNLPYSLFKLNESAYHGVTGPFSPGMPFTEDGTVHQVFTFAHELGHATGHADEYLNDKFAVGTFNYHSIDQFFECYTMISNYTALMYLNGAPRSHHMVYNLNALEFQITFGALKKKQWLQGKKFVSRYNFSGGSYSYKRFHSVYTIPFDPRIAMFSEGKLVLNASNPRKTIYAALYYVSQDESSCRFFHPGQNIEYQAVLMVRVLLSVDFSWLTSTANRASRISAINDAWEKLSCKYRLVNGIMPVQNIIIHFLMGFSYDDETAKRNYQADLSWHGIGSRVIVPSAGTSDEITIRSDATGEDAVAYFLNIANPADLNNTPAMLTHLNFLKVWADKQMKCSYTLESV